MVIRMLVSVNAGKDRNEGENQIVRAHARLVFEESPRIDTF